MAEIECNNQYKTLQKVLGSAYVHAAFGKGNQRHAGENDTFENQIGMTIQRCGFDFARGQAVKKIHESLKLQPGEAIAELLGAINYCAMAIIDIEGRADGEMEKSG